VNPYTQAQVVRQLFVSEPFSDTIAVVDLTIFGTAPNQVFGLGSVAAGRRVLLSVMLLIPRLAP
jgi:hypothetical protein